MRYESRAAVRYAFFWSLLPLRCSELERDGPDAGREYFLCKQRKEGQGSHTCNVYVHYEVGHRETSAERRRDIRSLKKALVRLILE